MHRSRAYRAPRPRPRGRSPRQAFKQAIGREPGQVGKITVPLNPQKALGPEAVPHFWHPERSGVVPCPDDFARRLALVHPDLRIVRPAPRAPLPKQYHCWTLWVKQPRVTQRLCPGWQLLMPWSLRGQELPLDERLFAAIAHFDSRHLGENAVQYFDRLIRERDRARERSEKAYKAGLMTEAKEWLDSTKITSAGRGNKFALHHDGTIYPSRGEMNWTRERERMSMPKRVLQDMERRRDG